MAKYAAAAGAGVGALILVAFAVWYLAQSLLLALEAAPLSPALSYLITGVVGVVLAAFCVTVAKAVTSVRSRAPAPASTAGDVARQLGGVAAAQIMSASKTHPYGTIGVAMAAGLVAGALPELRTLLINALTPKR